jgi:hypothetical protein
MVGVGEEVDENQLRDVVLQESTPCLRRRPAAAHHVFAHASLADIDAQLEQLAVNARCTPTGILSAHPVDQVSDLAGNARSTRLPVSNLPSPQQPEAFAMPGHDGFRFHDD